MASFGKKGLLAPSQAHLFSYYGCFATVVESYNSDRDYNACNAYSQCYLALYKKRFATLSFRKSEMKVPCANNGKRCAIWTKKARTEETAISKKKQKPDVAEVDAPNGSHPPGVQMLFTGTHAPRRGTAGVYLINGQSRRLYSATGSIGFSKYTRHP